MRVLTLVIVCVFLTMYNCYYLTQQTVLLRFLFVPDHQMIQIEHNSVIPPGLDLDLDLRFDDKYSLRFVFPVPYVLYLYR